MRRPLCWSDRAELADALPALPAWAEPGFTWAPAVTAVADGSDDLLYVVARDAASESQCIGVAGLAKLADRAGSQQAVRDFGQLDWLARPLGVLLPRVELGIAVALLPAVSAW